MDYNLTLIKTVNNPNFRINGRNYGFDRQFNILTMFEQLNLNENLNIDEINIMSASFDQDTKEKIDFNVNYFYNRNLVNNKTVDVKIDDIDKTKDFDKITFTVINTKGINYFNVNKCSHILFYLNHLRVFYLVESNKLKQYIIDARPSYTKSDDDSIYIRLNTNILDEICIMKKFNT